MPIERKKGESKDDYMGRCIGIEINSGYEPSQAAAICYAKWDEQNMNSIRDIRMQNFKIINGNTRTRNNTIRSSNVWKFKWDDRTGDLVVKFQDGSTYTYYGVNENDFESFRTGSGGTCDTSGSTRVGGSNYTWEIGKNPSVGAAVWDVLMDYRWSEGGSI
jgi:hypothetical protein